MVVADDRYEALLAAQPDHRPTAAGRGPDDRYGLWTGGTTGMPKGVMWRHEDIYLSVVGGSGNPALGIAPVADLDDVAARAAGGYPLPGHADPVPADARRRVVDRLLGAAVGHHTRAHPRPRASTPAFALRVMAEEQVDVVMTIGDAYARPIVDHLEAAGTDAPTCRRCSSTAPVGPSCRPRSRRRSTGCCPTWSCMDGFGASETGGQGSAGRPERRRRPGVPMGPSNVVIADDGTLCTRGTAGSGCWPPAATSRSATTRTRPRRRPPSRWSTGCATPCPGTWPGTWPTAPSPSTAAARCRSTPAARRSSPRRSRRR